MHLLLLSLAAIRASNSASGSSGQWLGSLMAIAGPTIISALISGGAVIGFLKFRPERDLIIAQAADQAVETVTTLLDQMRRDLHEANGEVARLLSREKHLLARIDALEQRANDAIADLRSKLAACQQELADARKAHLALIEEHARCGLVGVRGRRDGVDGAHG